MLEFDDIQHILLTRTPAITGRYEFLTFDTSAGGRAWLSELIDRVQSATDAKATMDESDRWITLAFTWTGLRALGVPEDSLATFPDEFREGMPSRASILGDTGPNAPEHWVGGLAGDDVHAIAILFSRTEEQNGLSIAEHDKLLARTDGVRSLSFLDLNASPPFNYAHDHFGFRDRLSQPVMKGSGEEPTQVPGQRWNRASSSSAIPMRTGRSPICLSPRCCRATVATWRTGGWRNTSPSSAIICARTPRHRTTRSCSRRSSWGGGAAALLWYWHQTRTTPSWARIPCATTTSTTRMTIRSATRARSARTLGGLNPRDTAHYMNRRRMIRRGATYGPALPDGAPDDGVDRGIAAFIICANLYASSSSPRTCGSTTSTFHELGNEHDPICGVQDGTLDYTVPKRPIRKVHKGIPAFTTLTGGAYFFLPGINAMRYLLTLGD